MNSWKQMLMKKPGGYIFVSVIPRNPYWKNDHHDLRYSYLECLNSVSYIKFKKYAIKAKNVYDPSILAVKMFKYIINFWSEKENRRTCLRIFFAWHISQRTTMEKIKIMLIWSQTGNQYVHTIYMWSLLSSLSSFDNTVTIHQL